MTTKTQPKALPMAICYDCNGALKAVDEYHPLLYCELVKLGHHQPEKYLASYGFTRAG